MDLLKRHNILTLLILGGSLFVSPLFAQLGNTSDSVDCRIELMCEYSGLAVWLDDEQVGETPLSTLRLKKGYHTLRVTHPDPSDWLHRDWEKKFFLDTGDSKRFIVTFPKPYWLGSDPSGASVFIKNRWIGETPMVIDISPDSLEFLMLKKAGYTDYSFDRNWSQTSLIQVKLKRSLMNDNWKDNSPQLKKRWIVASGIMAVICGGVGYYYKAKADRAYKRYLHSSHPETMDRYFSDAVTFDKLTGVFYGLGEISLGISVFFFIKGMWSE